jgi:hypothetical protein
MATWKKRPEPSAFSIHNILMSATNGGSSLDQPFVFEASAK